MHSAKKALLIRPAKRDELIAWFGVQPEKIRLEIIDNKIQTYHRWASQQRKEKELTPAQADYAALLSATMDAWRGVKEGKKAKDFDLRVQIAKEKKKARVAPAATAIENDFMPLIHKLRIELYKQWHPSEVRPDDDSTAGQ